MSLEWPKNLSVRGMERARAALGVKRDVMLRFEKHEVYELGCCFPSANDDEPHLIYINPELSKHDANFVVLHELVHALQEERDQAFSRSIHRDQLVAAGFNPEDWKSGLLDDPEKAEAYNKMPLEVEANHWASQNNDIYEVIIG